MNNNLVATAISKSILSAACILSLFITAYGADSYHRNCAVWPTGWNGPHPKLNVRTSVKDIPSNSIRPKYSATVAISGFTDQGWRNNLYAGSTATQNCQSAYDDGQFQCSSKSHNFTYTRDGVSYNVMMIFYNGTGPYFRSSTSIINQGIIPTLGNSGYLVKVFSNDPLWQEFNGSWHEKGGSLEPGHCTLYKGWL